MSTNRFTIMLLDDHPAILNGLRLALTSAMFEVVGAYRRVPDFFAGMEHFRDAHGKDVDVALLDYSLGDDAVDGISLIHRTRRDFPGTRLISMTAMEQDGIKTLVISAGAHGYIGKSVGTEAIPDHILAVMRNKVVIEPPVRTDKHAIRTMAGITPAGVKALTTREMEVLRCLLDGMTTGEIAKKFSRTSSTISTQIGSLFRKLGVASVSELHSQKDAWRHLVSAKS